MEQPKRLTYTYYHCSWRKQPRCRERSIRGRTLDRQIDDLLRWIQLPETFKDWALKALRADGTRAEEAQQAREEAIQERLRRLSRELTHINRFILSPEADWQLISLDEIRKRKNELVAERHQLENAQAAQAERSTASLELTERTFIFATYARFWFQEGGDEQKRAILAALGSNLRLSDRKLSLDVKKPLLIVEEMTKRATVRNRPFEPSHGHSNRKESAPLQTTIPWLRGGVNDVRTYWREHPEALQLPVFPS